MEYQNNHYRSAFPSYLGNSLLKPRNFYDTGIEKSLEDIVLKEEPDIERGMIDKIEFILCLW